MKETTPNNVNMAPTLITPEDWGPFLWHMLYVVSMGMAATPSDDESRGFVKLIDGLSQTLPCSICRGHFATYVKDHPPSQMADTRDNMVLWVMDAHNAVRKRQNKPPLNSSDIQQMIVDNHARNKPSRMDLCLRYGGPLALGLVLGGAIVYSLTLRKG